MISMEKKTLYAVNWCDYNASQIFETFESEDDANEVCEAYDQMFPGCMDVIQIETTTKPWWVVKGVRLFCIDYYTDIHSNSGLIHKVQTWMLNTPEEGTFTVEWAPGPNQERFLRCYIWAESEMKARDIARQKFTDMKRENYGSL